MSRAALTLCAAASLATAQDISTLPLGRGDGLVPPREGVLRVGILGDYGTTEPESFAVASLVRAVAPHLLITLGDNNYPDGAAATIDANIGQHYHAWIAPYRGAYGPGAEVNRFFPTLGNHDWRADDAQPYLDYFELPGNERYYDFRRGPVHFFALDSDDDEPDGITRDSAQARWLEPRLRASDAPFRIVYLHHAPYGSSRNHGSQGELQWPFAEWGASIVLAGHDHVYERISVSGLPYIVNGLGGRDAYQFGARIGGTETRFAAQHGALFLLADDEFARFWFLTSSGSVQDDFTLPRGGIDPGCIVLVPEDAAWRFLDTGVDPGPGWKSRGFDDAGWSLGRAELGYGDGDEETSIGFGGDPADRHVTTWFRREFQADPGVLEELQLQLLRDDGAVVYLNGAEILRVNMPDGAITSETLALDGISGNSELRFTPYRFGTELLEELQARVAGTGRNVLAVEVHQSSPDSNDVSFAAELVGLRAGDVLLPRGSHWRYRDSGVSPGPHWMQAGFDDSAWPIGRAELGYGENDQATEIDDGGPTAWFRATFTVADVAAIRWLSLRMLRDDGVIVYLNGTEALRWNVPGGGVTPATLASFNVARADEDVYERTSLDPRLLVEGLNSIAVQVHQAKPAGNDLSFDLELAGYR
jgi:tartrate-resistant acid phosphatase type 5